MLQGTTDPPLEDLLLRVAHDPGLREDVYQQLREYCHQCRNQLNSLKLSLYLARKQAPSPTIGLWIEIERTYQDLEARVEQIHFLCRPLQLSRVKLGLDLLIEDRREAWCRRMTERGGGLVIKTPLARAVASFDVDALGRTLDSVVTWRASIGPIGRLAVLRWWIADDLAHVAWEERPARGQRLEASTTEETSAWILPLLAKVVLAHGGEYRIDTDRGWRLELRWPAAG